MSNTSKADDNEPITYDWFIQRASREHGFIWLLGDEIWLECWRDGRINLETTSLASTLFCAEVPTRGRLRAFCEAFGVELKEPEELLSHDEKVLLYCIQICNDMVADGLLVGGCYEVAPERQAMIRKLIDDGFSPSEEEIQTTLAFLQDQVVKGNI